jgi:hypothetical protein
MMPVVLDIDGLTCALDPADGTWRIEAGGVAYSLSPWTWSERVRLVAAALRGGGFDRDAFLRGLCELLYDPAPPDELTQLFACAALRLLSVPEDSDVPTLSELTRHFAERFHWTPGMLDSERAADLDRLVADPEPGPAPQPPPGAGWTSIHFSNAGETGGLV